MNESGEHLRRWDEAAAAYCCGQRGEARDLAVIYEPAVDALLGDVSGKRVLDAGCGGGDYSRKLAARGALVTAIDGSAEMVSIAKRHPKKANVEYRVLDLTQTLPFPKGRFDVVLANMVLMDIPQIGVTIAEFARVLRSTGALVFSITHPCFFCSDWTKDAEGRKLHKPIGDYMELLSNVVYG
ncbi:MAG: class I SAM-dependent methyltransferase, partial [Candidatus Brocadiia bacterium]|nr:class I SAM-dependent methyltransferase [Candidatus Brocadiia bacterium]